MAVTGKQEYAPSLFEHQESVLNAGVLFALPVLISQGMNYPAAEQRGIKIPAAQGKSRSKLRGTNPERD